VVGRVAVGRVFIRVLWLFLSVSFRQGTINLSGQTVELLGPSARAPLSYQKDKRDLQTCISGNRGALVRNIHEAYRLVHRIICSYVHLLPYLTHCSLRLMVSA
jgi:hypothetical protein